MQLTDDNQCGFCPGRSTADATQILIRMEVDVEDLRRRRREEQEGERLQQRSSCHTAGF